MEMKMKIYHCTDPKENPLPGWMRVFPKKPEKPQVSLPQDPELVFPEFMKNIQRF